MNDHDSMPSPPPLSPDGASRRDAMRDELQSSMQSMHRRRRAVRRSVGSVAMIGIVAIGVRMFWPAPSPPTSSPSPSVPNVVQNTVDDQLRDDVTHPEFDVRVVSNAEMTERLFVLEDSGPASWIEVLETPQGVVDVAVIESDAGLAFALAELDETHPVIRVGEELEIPGLVVSPLTF